MPSYPPPDASAPADRSPLRTWTVTLLTLLLAATGLSALASPAGAAPVYDIEGEWVQPPATVTRGTPVVAEWRVNVNDDQPAPSNDPVANVTATFTVDKAFFDDLPDLCRTAGVTPASSISPDGRSLTCNFGTVDRGTALVLQTPVVANGVTGEEIVLDGTSPSGENVALDPILIQNAFAMDMQFAGTSNYNNAWDNASNPTYVDVPFNWSLRLGDGSDPGPDTVSYRLTLSDVNGSPVQVGTHPAGVGQPYNDGVQGCTNHDLAQATGHPYSVNPGNPRNTNFVDSCTLTPVAGQPGVFTLTLSGINYDLINVPTEDSFGDPLPTDWDYVASGFAWFRIMTGQAGSVSLTSDAPTYTAPTGQQSTDLAGNNAATKTYVLPGGFSAAYLRGFTDSGGDRWDDTYRVSAGTTLMTYVANHLSSDVVAPTASYGMCQVLQTQYVDFDPTLSVEFWATTDAGAARYLPTPFVGAVLEYYTGGVGDPDTFNCGTGTWTTTRPADPTTISAVRVTFPHSTFAAEEAQGLQIRVPTRIQDDVAVGQDIWTFGSYLRNGTWVSDAAYAPITSTSGAQYPHTNIRRDVVVVVLAAPAIRKAAAGSTVTPGVPAQFTLTYSANGAGRVPSTVDGYVIRDVLPLGMTYVTGSAAPAPVLSTDGSGRQVLTWTLDDVPTNTPHQLVYEAVADPTVPAGTPLTNTATSSLAGEVSAPASDTVTTTTNGYTVISKTADTPYIPNLDGSGDGEGAWSVTLRSFDSLPQTFTDTIDVLPYEGDGRGTDFAGDYSLVAVEPAAGSTVYYTTADPATLSDDPTDGSNGAAGDPTGNTVGWSTVFTPNATAVRVVGPQLAPGGTQQFKVRIATDGADPQDVYVNRAQARTGHTRLRMRTSEPMSVAFHYAATLKKYVLDNKGVWRDAQDLTDYPAFRYGDTVRYRIVVTNVGQGTLTNVQVTDDQRPDLGNFTVASLASGESESHEYQLVLDESTDGTVVNTASATVDTPPDVEVPPTIPDDPAGFEVANYTTVKSSVPSPSAAALPGERVAYTIRVTQQGTAPADAEFVDDLADVLDDATYNGDVQSSLGTVDVTGSTLAWKGRVPVGQVAVITYSVTVKSAKSIGNGRLRNPVTSPGCEVRAGATINCQTEHRVGKVDLRIDKKVVGSSQVLVGANVRYKLRVRNLGPDTANPPITVTDPLPAGLQAISAHGKGWDCTMQTATDKITCVRQTPLGPDRAAPPITIKAKATKAALGRRLVNTAKVRTAGDLVRSNNRDAAEVRVVRVPPAPSTGFRVMRGWF